jgi:16S rRNA (adenine1518-N6/adenine1519-N6)-dimethyltransferase
MTRTEVIKALKKAGLRPLKSLGQNFLIEQGLCQYIAKQIQSPPDDHWLEIGPGLGALTSELLASGAHLTAIEMDHGLANWLRENYQSHENLNLIEADAVKEVAKIPHISVATGNLPYYASTPILVELLKRDQLPDEMVFTLQKETGERFCAKHSTKSYGAITVLLQSCYQVECRRVITGEVFYPQPNIDSIVFYAKKKDSVLPAEQRAPFYQLLRKAFAQRRKKLRNTIQFDSDDRPEHLSVKEWQILFHQQKQPLKHIHMEDIFDIVDVNDEVIGSAPRSEVHAKGQRHRAVHIFVFNSKGEILLQLRSASKDKHPGTWDTSCCGHVDSGETYDIAAGREFQEELGPKTLPEFKSIGKCDPTEQTGQEFVTVYTCHCEGPFTSCPKEIDQLRWISPTDMEREMNEVPETYAPALPYLWEKYRDRLTTNEH